MGRHLRRFLRREDGAITVEYVVLTAAIVALGIAVIPPLGQAIKATADEIVLELEDVETPQEGSEGS